MILGIDGGNERVKVYGGSSGFDSFLADIGEYRELKLKNQHGEDDMVWEYEGHKGFAGSLARWESELGGSTKGGTKAHYDGKMRILFAVHRYLNKFIGNSVKIVVGQPIDRHTIEEKQKIIEMLVGWHELTINGDKKKFHISEVKVAAEGAVAGLINPVKGIVRIIDIGSGTVNCASLNDMKYLDRESFTEPFGLSTLQTTDEASIARRIANACTSRRWKKGDHVILVGGGAKAFIKPLKAHFPNAVVITLTNGLDPVYANAIGFYEIGRKVYHNGKKDRSSRVQRA
ncbi:ParM/StbA family protein [Mechercharimyces sp. CAU 1602]|uniref:ParM/StbA family protein n=1 Tax=Mechercharimyces sp. CAU 1602 TaxID=2973933 RepID=UPI0021639441|nr:hypothetical protein [Mechercharimyces sp. CAU 1602]MCS1351131.1 hypothetical protein [Mechercharimyces sp. CAU 1602]